MDHNGIWDLVELLEGCKRISCKWVYKTKCDLNGNSEQYNARLVAKILLKRIALTTKKPFYQSLTRTPLKLL